ncbi:hypothetical protein EMIHUDRAFT_114174 [Emiliania huxleyi CCMP1516]|uniref:Cysteine protease n=2 Tax=Emiliania huxleyi TaxID=2903 RepID=A0A0D3JYT0_EMIH1|nr:hypothetical protein EMIHUDRAFT_114174 [Emiliania huxleyi CCMP1516]EOD28665.1 hypothetical protein EMIHUDRAFT_114174 [Emiliania huxleyi CCMP1516]|eukprot:XP_005781094.1 hypothetical protein EMIHUDRAFT_114174 [Emiliania huxleyi CCMP1516]
MLESSTVVWLRSAAREASYRLARFLPESSDAVQPDSPIHILGTVVEASAEATAEVQACVRACLWFTYRQHFEPIPGTVFTSDAGWGCMMRSGQMILAQALLRLSAGGGGAGASLERREAATVALFADCLAAPYSLHRITLEGQAQGLPVGRWMGPASIAQVLVRLADRDAPSCGRRGGRGGGRGGGGRGCRRRSGGAVRSGRGERLLYLDPHEVQPALRPDDPDVASCHYGRGLRTVRVGDIDPSLAFGFLCGSADEFDELCAGCARVGSSSLSAFSIAEARVLCYERAGSEAEEAEPLSSDDDDDLVVL